MPQFDGCNRIYDTGTFSVAFWGGSNMPTALERIFHAHAKKIFLGIVVGNVLIQWSGIKFATPTHFRSRSGAVPICRLPGSDFFVPMQNKYFSALWWVMPQFDGWEPNLRHRCIFSRILGRFQNVGSREFRFFARMRKKYFLALWWGMSQFEVLESNLRHWRVAFFVAF